MPALALLYDVHGNILALKSVLEDARNAGADRFVLGGDYALFGPLPAETVDVLRGIPDATWIRGNVDRWSAFPEQADPDELLQRAISDCREALGADTVAELGALEEQIVLDGTRYCHASPVSDLESFMPQPGEDDERLLGGAGERRVVFGHTHIQFRRHRDDGIELINPGSVGMPLDGDQRAAYALVREDGSVAFRRVAYDHGRAAAALEERFGDVAWAQRSRRRILTAQL